MKVCIQFYGMLRSFREVYYHLINNIFSNYDLDVFIVTTDLNGFVSYSQLKVNPLWMPLVDKQIKYDLKDIDRYIRNIVGDKLKGLKIINNDKINRKTERHRKCYLCNKIRKQYEKNNNIQYDVVMTWRTDWVPITLETRKKFELTKDIMKNFSIPSTYPKQFVLEEMNLNNSNIYLFTSTMSPGLKDNISIWDACSISTRKVADIYCESYTKLFSYSFDHRIWRSGNNIEGQIQLHLIHNNINIISFKTLGLSYFNLRISEDKIPNYLNIGKL